jgi:site-specific recombinase XerD
MKQTFCVQSLYATDGDRKYVNKSERAALVRVISNLPRRERLFLEACFWTGARITEILSITPKNCQLDAAVVAVRTLKRRRFVVREIPVPRHFIRDLDRFFQLRAKQRNPRLAGAPIWTFHRVTGWRLVKSAMAVAGITGVKASPRGLRHSFGVIAVSKGVPLNMVQKLLGHASIKTTTIYTEASGPDEREIFSRFWSR